MSVEGAIFGAAYGDALGKPTEFMRIREITKKYGPWGPGEVGPVTDDTQMAMYVGESLVQAAVTGYLEPGHLRLWLSRGIVAWYRDPENDKSRAPGGTCLRAASKLERGLPWLRATDVGSKGCGANMRVHPIGLAAWLPEDLVAPVAQLQSALTHGHPTALAASDLTAHAVRVLNQGLPVRDLVGVLIDYAESQRRVYHGDWLEGLWRLQGYRRSTPKRFIERGWYECLQLLRLLELVQERGRGPQRNLDPCVLTGDGWVADEALATSIHCLLMYPEDATRAVRRAAVTRGDSDSLASITGALAGAVHGLAGFPAEWQRQIEYADRLADLVGQLKS